MSLEGSPTVDETCNRLEEVHTQLKAIQEHNAEVLEHLSAVQAIISESGVKLPSQMMENLTRAGCISDKVITAVESQCDILHHSYSELKRLPEASSKEVGEYTDVRNPIPGTNVTQRRERSDIENDLLQRTEAVEFPEREDDLIEEKLQCVKESIRKLVEAYRENTVKAEEQLARVQGDLEAADERVRGYGGTTEQEELAESEASSPAPVSPIHDPATSLSPILSDTEDKYLSLLEENRRQREEIQRLTEENTYLIHKSREVTSDVHVLKVCFRE